MSLLFGSLAHVWASILAVPLAIVVTWVILYCFRRIPQVQRIVMPGADECRRIERWADRQLDEDKPTPAHMQMMGAVMAALLIRNGITTIAVAIIFLAIFTGAHALLSAL